MALNAAPCPASAPRGRDAVAVPPRRTPDTRSCSPRRPTRVRKDKRRGIHPRLSPPLRGLRRRRTSLARTRRARTGTESSTRRPIQKSSHKHWVSTTSYEDVASFQLASEASVKTHSPRADASHVSQTTSQRRPATPLSHSHACVEESYTPRPLHATLHVGPENSRSHSHSLCPVLGDVKREVSVVVARGAARSRRPRTRGRTRTPRGRPCPRCRSRLSRRCRSTPPASSGSRPRAGSPTRVTSLTFTVAIAVETAPASSVISNTNRRTPPVKSNSRVCGD